jgi:hypothetical protein
MKIVGGPIAVRFVQSAVAAAAARQSEDVVVTPTRDERSDERQPVIMKDVGVQKILQTFKGRIRAEE